MFRTARSIIGLGTIGMVAVGLVVGWGTGFFDRTIESVLGLWAPFTEWLNQPLSVDHIIAGLGVLAAPLILLVIMFALTDD